MKLPLQKMVEEAAGIDAYGRPLNMSDPEAKPTEFDYANMLAATLAPIKTVGSDWFAYTSGVWRKVQRATLRPVAQEILPEPVRTARREGSILDHLEGRFQVPPDAFRGVYRFDDEGAILVNAANGIVRVTPGSEPQLMPPEPGQMFTQQTAANFLPDAKAGLFVRVLGEALPDPLDRELFQLCCGNFLWPDCRFEVALVCYGEAGRGKSTVAESIAAALGMDLVGRLSLCQICDPKGYYLPTVRFAAVNLGTELDVINIEESANFKTLVSGEPVEVRPIYAPPWCMETICKLWFLANVLPRFKNGTEAELRRTRFLRFDYLPPVKDVTLKKRLLAERDGVFNFMVAGLQKLLTLREIPLGGLESRSVHERFKISNDPLGSFVVQQCEFNPEAREPKQSLSNAFGEFCETNGLPAGWRDWFFRRLYERFPDLREVRTRHGTERERCVAGIRLKSRLDL
jgi:putative DNA primase/helicase